MAIIEILSNDRSDYSQQNRFGFCGDNHGEAQYFKGLC